MKAWTTKKVTGEHGSDHAEADSTMTIKLSRPSLIALAVSMSALSGGFTFAAEGMDISTMGPRLHAAGP